MTKLSKIIYTVLAVSILLNIILVTVHLKDNKQLKMRIEKLDAEKQILEEKLIENNLEIDSLLNTPLTDVKIIKEYIYEKTYEKYPNVNSVSNDSIIKLWTSLSNE